MPERKINLDEIWSESWKNWDEGVYSIKEIGKIAMKKAVKQAIELASKNVVIKNICDDCNSENLDIIDGYFHCKDCGRMDYTPRKIVNKQSILDVIKQLE